jgi:uncharacterized iron-regulated membrane protein
MERLPLRPFFGFLHRWVGLVMAVFLIFSGVTGAVISWDHELDEFLNPHLLDARTKGAPRPSLELIRELEARHPNLEVTSFPLAPEDGHSLAFWVEPKVDPSTGRLREVDYNQIFVDPASGTELGKRNGERFGHSRVKTSSPSCTSCTTPCTCPRCSARIAGASGCSGASRSCGRSTASSART